MYAVCYELIPPILFERLGATLVPFGQYKHTATSKCKTNKIDEIHKKSMNYTIPTVEPYKSCIFGYIL